MKKIIVTILVLLMSFSLVAAATPEPRPSNGFFEFIIKLDQGIAGLKTNVFRFLDNHVRTQDVPEETGETPSAPINEYRTGLTANQIQGSKVSAQYQGYT